MRRGGQWPKEPKEFGYYEIEWLVKIWVDEEIQQPLSVMSRKQNIGRTLPQNLMTMVTSAQHRTAKPTIHNPAV